MPQVVSVATAVPPYQYSQTQVTHCYGRLHGDHPETVAAFSILDHSGVENRYLCFPPEYYLAGHSFERRNRDYVEQALALSEQAIRACLDRGEVAPDRINHIVLITTTGLATPSLDAMLVQRIPLSPEVRRTPIFGVGCAGGAVGLARTIEFLHAHPNHLALLVSVELCGQTFDASDQSKLGAVAVSLFGDGAAAVLLAGDEHTVEGPRCLGSQSVFFPDSLDIMGWDFTNEGMRLVLSRRLPALVKRKMPHVIAGFLSAYGLSRDEVKYWIFHPGSGKVLDAYESSLELPPEKLIWAREFLRQYANLSSASVLFILNEIIERGNPQPGDYGLVVAVGPGFSAELVLLQW
ncbi:MAG: type III polyketide synthase [Acidobacteria bacterium]|nr:type III polyketide synthase [Acidobacteriota bacterium]